VSIIQILNCVFTKMSCGNRFQCGLKKATRFSFQPDKPSNPELHSENQKRLDDLLRAREEMDKGLTTAAPAAKSEMLSVPAITSVLCESLGAPHNTPWKIPSALDYQKKNK
jgi:hypothetical protein